ncbi:MAG TPA: amidohydrolase [Dehalococcoidia bacterium]|nr:amidohydrolase [Dehalococcoidia bacterium]
MIIDVHYHFFSRWPADENVARNIAEGFLLDGERTGVKKTMEEVLPVYRKIMDDPESNELVRRMDEGGIDVTAICVVDNVDMGLDKERVMNINKRCATAAAGHPGRLIALAGIDPRRPDAPTLFRRCIEEFGMKGLKWHPDNGYYPNSPEAYAVLEVVNELRVPLLIHCSPLPHSRAKYALPIHLDDVAVDFPDLEIIAAHMGNMWWRDWLSLAQYKKNINGDMAMWQLMAVSKPHLFRRYLREILDVIGAEQVLFGTDGPIFEPHVSNKDFVDIIENLTEKDQYGICFSQEEINAILGSNAARIFRLDQDTREPHK